MDDVDITCCSCGVEFCMPTHLYEQRVKDHGWFYCPNGHQQHFTGKTEEEKKIDRLERFVAFLQESNTELHAQREDLIGALKECPVPGCTYRSRRQVPRAPVDMGRGIERVRADLFEHLVRDHAGRVPDARQLPAGAAT